MKHFLFGLWVVGTISFHAAGAVPILIKEQKTVFDEQAHMRDLVASKFVNFRPGLVAADCLMKLYKELTYLNVTFGDVVRSITVQDLSYDDGSKWMGLSIVFENPQMKRIKTLGSNELCPTILKMEKPLSAK